MLKYVFLIAAFFSVVNSHAQRNQDNKINVYVESLMKKMTLDEKIGQLNLLTPGGGVATGSVVSSDVESKIKKGMVGGLFGIIGVEKIRQAQQLAMKESRLHIPLIFGSDVIHGCPPRSPHVPRAPAMPVGCLHHWQCRAPSALAPPAPSSPLAHLPV